MEIDEEVRDYLCSLKANYCVLERFLDLHSG